MDVHSDKSPARRRIVLAGGSGFLGQALATHFANSGWAVAILTRGASDETAPRRVYWDARTTGPWEAELDGAAAVVNLTGKSVDFR